MIRKTLFLLAAMTLAGCASDLREVGKEPALSPVGAGIDYALTDQFVVGAQYRYYDFGSEHFDGTNGFSDRDQSTNLNTVRLNLSYKF